MDLKKIEKYLLCIFSAAIFTSKPAIYIASVLMVMFFIYRCIVDAEYKSTIKRDFVLFGAFVIFVFGLLAKILSPGSLHEIGHFAYKGMFLLAFPALVHALQDKANRKLSISIAMAGFLVSVIWSFVQAFILLPHAWSGERFGGLWDVGRWAEITTFAFSFILPKLSDDISLPKKIAVLAFLCITFLSLIVSGGRAGWVAASFSLAIYMVFMNRKMLFVFLPLCGVLVSGIYFAKPVQFNSVISRVTSIFEKTEKDHSNFSRILMWGNGISLLHENMSNEPMKFLFGIGVYNFQDEYVSYLNQVSKAEKLVEMTQGNYSLKDLHNAYLDSANKMGVLYTAIFYLSLIILIFVFAYMNAMVRGVIIIVPFFILGVFYTNYLEFQTSIFFFIVALAYSEIVTSYNKVDV